MAFVHRCPKCGLELTGNSASKCPMCGLPLNLSTGRNIWIGAAIQITMSTVFMLLFHFPKVMIVIFGGMILAGTALSARIKATRMSLTLPAKAPTLSHPVLWRIASLGVALSSLVMFSILLFGFVIFMDSWNRWHQYEGQPFRRSEFRVEHVYYQKQSKSYSFYASGTVEGHREWISLQPTVQTRPRSQAEAEASVPPGTLIPIYFFPNMKGRARVQVYEDTPPAESAHRKANETLNTSLLWLAITGMALFVMLRIRSSCVDTEQQGVRAAGAGAGN